MAASRIFSAAWNSPSAMMTRERRSREDLDPLAQLLALREELIELDLSEDVPQGRLGEEVRRLNVVLDLRHRLQRVVDAIVHDGVDFDGHVVAAHDALPGHIEGDRPEVDEHTAIEDRDDYREPRPFRRGKESPETEDHQAFVLPHDFDRGPQDHEHQDDCQYRRKDEFLSRHAFPLLRPTRRAPRIKGLAG